MRRVTEISSGMAVHRAEKGELLEVQAVVTAPAAGSALPVEQLMLSGSSRGEEEASTWELTPLAVGAGWNERCSYELPGSLVQGGVGFGDPPLWLKREAEGSPAILEFPDAPVQLCAAFIVPAGASGTITLHLAAAEFIAIWPSAG